MTSPAQRRGRPRSLEADAAILDAAIDEITERGFADVTIDRIASRAGVARTTVYRRWSNLTHLCMEAVERIREHLPPPPGTTVRDDLVFLVRHINRILTETRFGQLLPQLAAEAQRSPETSRTYWVTYLARGRGSVTGVLSRGIQEGIISADADLEFVTDMLIGPLLHRTLWRIDSVTDDQVTALVDTVLNGLHPHPAAPPPGAPPR
jgi:AcrR family transcriptional regulator